MTTVLSVVVILAVTLSQCLIYTTEDPFSFVRSLSLIWVISQVLEFWPFTSSTSPFAPFFESPDALSVPRPLSLDEPYLPADEYPTTRWVREEERMTVMMDTARVLFLRACFVIPYSYISV